MNAPIAQAQVAKVNETFDSLRREVGKVVVGQEEVVERVIVCLLCRGHALLVGVPGLAKTLLVSTVARTLNLQFNRIQFTPDLMPSDITGTELMEEDRATGKRAMRFVTGPVFANILLDRQIISPESFTALLLMAIASTMLSIPLAAPKLRLLMAHPGVAREPVEANRHR